MFEGKEIYMEGSIEPVDRETINILDYNVKSEHEDYVVLSTPKKESEGKLFYELDWSFVKGMAERMQHNKKNGKYPVWNWTKKMSEEDLIHMFQAVNRHFIEIAQGNLEDDGQEYGHLFALATDLMIIKKQLELRKNDF